MTTIPFSPSSPRPRTRSPLSLYSQLELGQACSLLRLTPAWTLRVIARLISALDMHLQPLGYRVSARWSLIDPRGQPSGHHDRGSHFLVLVLTGSQGRARGLLYLACQAADPAAPLWSLHTPDSQLQLACGTFEKNHVLPPLCSGKGEASPER